MLSIGKVCTVSLFILVAAHLTYAQLDVVDLQPYTEASRPRIPKPFNLKLPKPKVSLSIEQGPIEISGHLTTVTFKISCEELLFSSIGENAVGKIYLFLRFRNRSAAFDRFTDGIRTVQVQLPLANSPECQKPIAISKSVNLAAGRYELEAVLADVESGAMFRKKQKLNVFVPK